MRCDGAPYSTRLGPLPSVCRWRLPRMLAESRAEHRASPARLVRRIELASTGMSLASLLAAPADTTLAAGAA
ncbi:hypothetical protein WI26_21200 [Burkholderia diffusa]|nr:hypothetical protein WI26_21200 [Burkholderia diffusa]